ncbi:MAG: DCC1-like thiol-disulfide oxidoreductase family protein [Pseudomonadota bacterium]
MDAPTIPEHDFLVYDGECPVCDRYVVWTGLRRQRPEIQLLDARLHPALVSALRADGIEVNDTFVLQLDGTRHIGAAAMSRISNAIAPASKAQRLLKWMTRSEHLMRPLYPLLVRARKFLLAALGRNQIR